MILKSKTASHIPSLPRSNELDDENDKQADEPNGDAAEKDNDTNVITNKLKEKIFKFREQRKSSKQRMKNLTVIKRSNKVCEALNLPKVLNLNPRSIYNKIDEFATFVTE